MSTWHEIGTKVQNRNGYIHVKIQAEDGEVKWQAESRRIWELQRGELEEGDRVYHIDGDRTNNRIGNLAKVHFNSTKFILLKKSRVLWTPKRREQKKEIPYYENAKDMDRRIAATAANRPR